MTGASGIYTVCDTCGVLVADQNTHEAWHNPVPEQEEPDGE